MAYRKPKSSHILVPHHDEICEILSTTDTILLPFTAKLFGKQVIDRSTKNEISQKAGYKAADTLLDCLEMRVDRNPRLLQTVLEVMREVDALTHVAEKMEKEWSAKQEVKKDIPVLTDPSMIDKLNPIVEAGNLKQDFEELLVAILDAVHGVDLDNLKLRISWFFNAEGFITADVQAILDQLQSLTTPQNVLNFLITRNFIGYLNYELTKAFQKAVKSEQLKARIEEYEDKHDAFLHHFSFNAIIEAFRQRPNLAPVSVVGLPQLTVRLKTPWEGRSVYEWKEVLAKLFTWPPHLIIVSIEKNCIVLTYAVLPFFISSVLRDLKDPQMSELLKKELATVEFSEVTPSYQQVPVTSQEIITSTGVYKGATPIVHRSSTTPNEAQVQDKHSKDDVVVSKVAQISSKEQLQSFIARIKRTTTEHLEYDLLQHTKDLKKSEDTLYSVLEEYQREKKALENKEEKYKIDIQQQMQERQTKVEEEIDLITKQMTEQEENQRKEMELEEKSRRRLEDEKKKLIAQLKEKEDEIAYLKWRQKTEKNSDNQPLEEKKKASLSLSPELDDKVKEMLSLIQNLKVTSDKEEKEADLELKVATLTETLEKLRAEMESLQHKLESATKVSVDETDEVTDARKQFEVLSSVIKELRLTEEEGTETQILLDKLQKELHVLSMIIEELNKDLLDTKEKVRVYKKMCLVKSQELDKHARKKPQPHLSDIEDTDDTSLEEDEKGSLYTSQELVDEVKKKLSVIEELKITAEEKKVIDLDKETTLTEMLEKLTKNLESLQNKLDSGQKLSTDESDELMDSLKQLDDLIHSINNLRLTEEESTDTRWKEDSLEKDVKQEESQEKVTTDGDEGEERSLNTNDVAVQFDYWVPMEDLLHGAHVVDEIVFNVHSDREQTYEWNECGFKLYVPKGALSPTEVCPVAIKALLGGRFILPEDTELVSALYAISQSRDFQKPVKAELQHCVFLENEAQTKRLHFIKAYQTQPGMPYLFKFAEGGEFPLENRYGSLWDSEFCIFGIVRENGPDPVSDDSEHPSDDEDENEPPDNDDDSTSGDQAPNVQNQEQNRESQATDRPVTINTVQVPDDIPDQTPPPQNIVETLDTQRGRSQASNHENSFYRAHTFYERVSRNKWTFKFAAVRHLKVHIKYVVDSFSSLEKAEAFKFRFKDIPGSSDHSILLRFTDEENAQLDRKWHVEPFSLPCEIFKEDIDLLGTQEMTLQGPPETPDTQVYPDIPMCMISLYCDEDITTRLRYGVPVEGINEKKTIFIMRHVETLQNTQESQITEGTSQYAHHEQKTSQTSTCTPDIPLEVEFSKLKAEIQRIFDEHLAGLSRLLKNNLKRFADELFSAGIISEDVKSSPSYDSIMDEFISIMEFKENALEIVNHTVLFLKTLSKLGTPQNSAATSIAHKLSKTVDDKLKVKISFTW